MDNNDINKIEHLGQKNEGCATGQHIWDEAEGHSTVEKDGDLTKMKLRCLLCGKQFDVSVPLGLNDYIGRQQNIQQTYNPTQQITKTSPSDGGQSDILKRILN